MNARTGDTTVWFEQPQSKINWQLLREQGSKISILWDLENAPPVPQEAPLLNPLLGATVSSLKAYFGDKVPIANFWCFGAKEYFYKDLREALKAESVLMKDTSMRKKNQNIPIIVEITKLIAAHKPPHAIVLITGGNRDFSALLNFIVSHRYTLVLISAGGTSSHNIPTECLEWYDFLPKTTTRPPTPAASEAPKRSPAINPPNKPNPTQSPTRNPPNNKPNPTQSPTQNPPKTPNPTQSPTRNPPNSTQTQPRKSNAQRTPADPSKQVIVIDSDDEDSPLNPPATAQTTPQTKLEPTQTTLQTTAQTTSQTTAQTTSQTSSQTTAQTLVDVMDTDDD